MEPGWDYNLDGANIDPWVHQSIITAAMLLVAISQCPMLSVMMALFLEEAMEDVDCSQVLKGG